MIQYKIDVMQELKEAGYTTTRIRAEKLISENSLQKIRTGSTALSVDTIDKLCKLLDMQPGNILKYIED